MEPSSKNSDASNRTIIVVTPTYKRITRLPDMIRLVPHTFLYEIPKKFQPSQHPGPRKELALDRGRGWLWNRASRSRITRKNQPIVYLHGPQDCKGIPNAWVVSANDGVEVHSIVLVENSEGA